MTAATGTSTDLGKAYNPFDQAQIDDPYPMWAVARSSEPIFYSDSLNAWIVTSYQLVQEVLQNQAAFLNGGLATIKQTPPEVLEILAQIPQNVPPLRAADPPGHTRRRKVAMAAVSPRRVAEMENSTRAIANRLLAPVLAAGRCDFYEAFAYRFPLAVISSVLGFPDEDGDRLHDWANRRLALAWGNMELDEWKKNARAVVDFHHYIEAEIGKRQKEPRDDLISDLLSANRAAEETLDLPELIEQVHGFVTAGHESTANLLTLSLYHLLDVRSRWESVCANPGGIPQVLEETMRFDNSVKGIWRKAAGDTTVGGVQVRAGDTLHCMLGSTNRDDKTFANADTFVVGRPNARHHMSFGRGAHTCVGATLARAEGRIAFEVLVEKIPGVRLAQGPMKFVPNATLRIPKGLMIEWDV